MTKQGETTVRAAIYLRISLDMVGQEQGVKRQREDCLRHCELQGWEVAEEHIYVDNDVSAYKNRPDFNRMIRAVEDKRVDAIVAWQPDRLYRRFSDLERLVTVIESHAVMVSTVKAGDLNLDSAYGRMVARMLSVIAMGEGELKAERWKRSWRQGREQGAPAKTGSRLFGYTRDGEVIPYEAEVARQMADDLLAGVTIAAIASGLEKDGVLTTRGTVWRTGTVRQYLNNPRIAGYSTLKGDVVAEGKWEPVVDRETWETVKGLLTSRTRVTPPRVAMLGGLIFCGGCGHRLITGSARGRRSYRCPNRPGMRGCGRVSAYAGPVEEIVESYARARLADPRVQQRVAQLRSRGDGLSVLSEAVALEARLLELEAQLDVPGVPVDSIMRAMARTRDRLEECRRILAESTAAAPVAAYVGGAEWPDDLARRRQLVAVALGEEKVYLDPVGPAHNRFNPERVRIG